MGISKTRSGFEKRTLAALTAKGVAFEYEPKDKRVQYDAKTKTYTPDIVLANGIIIELKGYFKGTDRVKHLLIKTQHPELDIRFVFQRAKNKLSASSKTTYAAWCDKWGFMWAEGEIPAEWIREKRKQKRVDRPRTEDRPEGLSFGGPEALRMKHGK